MYREHERCLAKHERQHSLEMRWLGMTTGTLLHFPLPPLDEQANLVEKHKVDSLLYCPNPWAIRHVFINQETGETVRARCNRWDCLFCGPRKVDIWRQLLKAAEPALFLTLTKAGKTVEEAAQALTVLVRVKPIRLNTLRSWKDIPTLKRTVFIGTC